VPPLSANVGAGPLGDPEGEGGRPVLLGAAVLLDVAVKTRSGGRRSRDPPGHGSHGGAAVMRESAGATMAPALFLREEPAGGVVIEGDDL
jgi:hypothetical protein